MGSVLLDQLKLGKRVNAFDLTGHIHCGCRWFGLFYCERSCWHCNQIQNHQSKYNGIQFVRLLNYVARLGMKKKIVVKIGKKRISRFQI